MGASGSVDDYEVSYVWAKATGGRNTLQRSSVTLPSGNTITYSYDSRASLHDADASRVTQLADGGTALVTYRYNGLDTVVGTTLDEPDVMSKQFSTTSGDYPDLDRFNRVVTSKWTRDLATDINFYEVDLAYDRNSNITSATDDIHTGFDVLYTNDDLNRLVRAEEGTLSGGSISSRTRDQQWTLTQVGNWDVDQVDLNGDGDFVDTDELDDDRTHNDVNELTGRDIDDNGTDDYTLTYDEAGNLTDDGEDYDYEWDAFYRLRKIKDRSTSDLVAEYKYNGLGHRISIHEDTDDDGDVDASDKWFHHAYDERWRWVATFREDDTDPKEEFLHHAAGLDGRGTGSYIDLVILRDRDINSGWTSAADGTLEERVYYCQNWRADVSALVTDGGQMLEWVKYSAYGVPFGLPGGDADSDGDCDASDVSQVDTWVEQGPYDVRGDIDLDGDVDSTDSGTISSDYSGITLGRRVLSGSNVGNHQGAGGLRTDNWGQTYMDGSVSIRSPILGRQYARAAIVPCDANHESVNLYASHNPPTTAEGISLKCIASSTASGDVSPNGTYIFFGCDKEENGICRHRNCEFENCGIKFFNASSTKDPPIIDCPHGPCPGNPSETCIDYKALNRPPWLGGECWLWHGGCNITWSSSDPENVPPPGASEYRFDKTLVCSRWNDRVYTAKWTATSGNPDPGTGMPHKVSVEFTLTCKKCGQKKQKDGSNQKK